MSETDIKKLPDPHQESGKKQKQLTLGGAFGRTAGTGPPSGGDSPLPFTFRQAAGSGSDEKRNELLNGQGPKCEAYLIEYTKAYNGAKMPVERQLHILPSLWRIVNLKSPLVRDAEIDSKLASTEEARAFKARMITRPGPNSPKMGIENWWKYYAQKHRAASCNVNMRCMQTNAQGAQDRKLKPWCAVCNKERWGV